MKRPALWIAVAFSAGIGLERLHGWTAAGWYGATIAAIALGLLFWWRNLLIPALVAALAAWIALGSAAARAEIGAVPAANVTQLAAARKLDLSAPHRFSGILRDDALKLPWGTRLVINLESVESAGHRMPASGGLRLNYYQLAPNSQPLPQLRAGDRVEAFVQAREPRNFQDPGAFDYRGYLQRQGIDLTATLRAPELIQKEGTPRLGFASHVARLRGDLLARTDSLFGREPRDADLLRAMLLGDRSFVKTSVAQEFQQTGTYHVLVVAGLHVGVFLAFIYWLAFLLRLRIWPRTILSLAAVAAYAVIVQDRPPVLRAALVAAIFLLTRPLFRRVEFMQAVAISALLLLLWRPSSLWDASFQLSFFAAAVLAGIALPWLERTAEPWAHGLRHVSDITRDASFPPRIIQFRLDVRQLIDWLRRRLPGRRYSLASACVVGPLRGCIWIYELFILSLVLQAGMMPVMASYFHRVTLAGAVSNVPTVALTGLIVPAGFLALALSYVNRGLALVAADFVAGAVSLLLKVVSFFALLPHVSFRIPDPPLWLIFLFIELLAVLGVALASRSRWPTRAGVFAAIASLSLLAIAIVIAAAPFSPLLPRGQMALTVLDVGQGDSLFLAFPDGRTMLIDGGGMEGARIIHGYQTGEDIGEEVVSPYLWSRRIKHLNFVVLTHAHHDHMDGLRAVLRNFRVDELWVGRDVGTYAYQSLIEEANRAHVKIVHHYGGDTVHLDKVRGQFLWPLDRTKVAAPSNDDSLVLRVGFGSVHFLLPGDIERTTEKTMVQDGDSLGSQFLKVPHHGSKTSSTEDFLRAVSPEYAAISVGAVNSFGLPSPVVLGRLNELGIHYWTTPQYGAVTATTDGRSVWVQTYAHAPASP